MALRRRCAIKVLDDAEAMAEVRATATLAHPSIAPIHDGFRLDDGRAAVVMPYLAGRTLRDVLCGRSALPIADAALVLADIASALAYGHERGIVHRSVDASHVLLTPRRGVAAAPRAYLLGLAWSVDDPRARLEAEDAAVASVGLLLRGSILDPWKRNDLEIPKNLPDEMRSILERTVHPRGPHPSLLETSAALSALGTSA